MATLLFVTIRNRFDAKLNCVTDIGESLMKPGALHGEPTVHNWCWLLHGVCEQNWDVADPVWRRGRS